MRPNNFQARLTALMERGNLRVADVARWFRRRHSTVRGWVVDGREPAGTPADLRALYKRLNKLSERVSAYRQRTSAELRAWIKLDQRDA